MNEQQQNEANAVKILALAVEGYILTLDELSKNFVTPQVRLAVEIFGNIVAERQQAAGIEATVVEPVAPEAANDAEVVTK